MKFLCPSCKAKYQIADEKVIGRSVKMKCRQCGHIIEIQESVVGASTGVSLPPIALTSIPVPAPGSSELPPRGTINRPQAQNTGGGLSAKAPTKPIRPPGATSGRESKLGSPGLAAGSRSFKPTGATGIKRASPVQIAAPTAKPPASAASFSSLANVHTDLGWPVGPSSERPIHRPVRVQSSPSANAAPLAVKKAPPRSAVPSPTAPRVTGRALVAAPPARRAGEALAEAFTTAVGVTSAVTTDQFVGDEWYVGINDNPIGPIPLSDLRARAAQGQVTIDSLVWRDGFEDWKPVRSFPELLAVVEEAISSIHASRSPLLPTGTPDFGPAITFSPAIERQLALTPARETPQQSQQQVAALFVPIASPALTPEELAAVTGRGMRRSPKGAWIAVAGAVALGLAIGFVLFRQPPATPEIKYVEVARSGSAAVAMPPALPASSQNTPAIASAEETRITSRRVAANDTKLAADNNGTPVSPAGLKGLSGLRGLGPQSGPAETASNSGSTSGQALDSATLQKTVSRYTASVRRSCWQPALDSRASDAPTVARVSVKIDIAARGNVSGVSSNGDPRGYRGLANCIESRVRNWSFPPSSGATTVNVPFVFAAQ